jgi:hypothetical protein
MSMYKYDDSDYVNFVAQYQETFTRVGYKQSADYWWCYTSPITQLIVERDDKVGLYFLTLANKTLTMLSRPASMIVLTYHPLL